MLREVPMNNGDYITVQGDMWDGISHKLYGSCRFANILIESNPEYRDIQFFEAGIHISVPMADETTRISTLPPWKQVVS